MKGQAAAQRLLEFQTPYGTVGENAAYIAELYGVLRLLFHMAGRDAGLLVASVTLGLLKIPLALQLGQMWPWMAYVMDQGLDFGGTLITMMCASNLLALVGFVQNRLKDSFEPRFLERVQIAGVKACLSKDTAYWDSGDPAQSVTWLFQQAERVKGLMGHVETILTCAFTLGGAIIHLYTTSAKFTAVALAAALAIGAYMMWLNRLLAAVTGAMDHTLSELKGGCIESLTNIRTVQSFACELLEVSRFSGWKLAWWATKLQFRVTEALRRGSELSIDYARVLCINYGGFMLVSSGSMQVGDVILIQALLAEMLNSTFNSLVMTLRVVSIDLMFTKLYLDVLQAPVLIPQDAGVVPRAAARGSLSLQEVNFSYPARPDEPVLRGISIEVAPGSLTALVGASGSGKTTVGRLLERFYDVSSGCIFLDGIDLRDLQPRWLRRQIGYVEQEPRLYRGTIRENILYGNPNASEAQTEAAAEAARVLAFARDFPQGLDADVASGGQSLSGGQKQRLAIARAMIRDPAVILLDEATSALDTETERAVQEALERLLSGRTTLVVAHRLSTVVRADQIVVMGGGRVLESGRHSELCQRPGGAYAALVRHQQLEPSKASQGAAGVLGDTSAEVAAGGSCESATARDVAPAPDGGGASDATAASTGDMGGLEASASSAAGAPAMPGPPELVGATEPESVDGAEGAEAGIQARPRGRLPTEQQPSPVAERVEGTGGAGATAVEEPKQAADAGAEAQEALRRYMQTAAEAKRSQDNELFRTPDSDGFFRQLLWMYQLMGRRKWILFACLAVSVLEARAATRVGPAFSAASSFLDKPAEYVPAFQEYALVCVVTGVLTFVKERLKDYFEPHLAETLQWKCYYKMLHMDVDYFEKTDPASIVPRMFDQADFSAMSTSLATEGIVHGAAGIIFSAYEMYTMSPSTVKSTVAMAAPMGLILWFLFMGQVPHTVKIDKANAELTAIAVESLTNVRTTHAFGGDIVELAKFRRQKQAWWQAEMRRRPWHVGTDAFMTFCMTNMTFVVMVVIMRSGSGRFSSTMAGLLYMVKVFWDKALSFGFTVGALGNAKASFNALAEVLREQPLIEADVGDVPAPRAAGALEFRDVRFGYASRPGEEALRGISFSIPRGSCTAVVGHSGSGKTTLGRLLMRFHDPGAGQVLLDGRPFPSLQPQWLRRQIGYVEQEPRLFNETLWNNIRYGRLDAPSEEIFGAAMAANILQFMQSLPQGMETNVGRFGQNLSGGQKQRVAIARALLVNPAILLLDEATSALDSETEHAVHEALERLMAGRTSVVIAHRLSTVARADQVVVMDAGRVVQLGTHQELSRSGGHYARLLTALASADSPANESADDSPGDAGLRRRR